MKNKLDDLKFLLRNFCYPIDKINVSLGNTELSLRYKKAFTYRSWKRLFIPHKKFNCSIIDLNKFSSFDMYHAHVNGKNSAAYFSRRCRKLGYTTSVFNPNEYIEAIYKINTSKSERQGRTMDAGYLQKVESWPNDSQNRWIGTFDSNGNLVSYVWLVLMDELILINRILGDAIHLKNNIMYLNLVDAIEFIYRTKVGAKIYLMYDTFGRKQNGLVLFKKRIGFEPYTVNFI